MTAGPPRGFTMPSPAARHPPPPPFPPRAPLRSIPASPPRRPLTAAAFLLIFGKIISFPLSLPVRLPFRRFPASLPCGRSSAPRQEEAAQSPGAGPGGSWGVPRGPEGFWGSQRGRGSAARPHCVLWDPLCKSPCTVSPCRGPPARHPLPSPAPPGCAGAG